MTRLQIPGSPPQAGGRIALEIQGVMVAFRYCPPGAFLMGSPEDEEDRGDDENQHEVTLTRGFWLGETAVTQRFWKVVDDGYNPSTFRGMDARPVECIEWVSCDEFIKKLNSLGAAPFGMKFDYPTEAEWEYACRAGTTTPFNFGSQLNGDMANCDGESPYGTLKEGAYIEETVPVRSYPPNAWGLYEMHGNVKELCKDWYGAYPTDHVTDPTGWSCGTRRVTRGGRWNSCAFDCRSAARSSASLWNSWEGVGFRLVLRFTKKTD